MAPINPQIQPEQAPNYGYFSRPISQPSPDKTLGEAISGVGNLINEGTKGAEYLTENSIDTKLRNFVDSKREAVTGGLEELANIPQNLRISSVQPAGQPDIIPGQEATPLPAGLQAGLSQAAKLQNGSNYGKIPDALYRGQLAVYAKQLRAQYPGHVDYIDAKMAELTGGNPANQYISDLMSIANATGTKGAELTNKALAEFGKTDVSNMPGIQTYIAKVANGQAGPNPYAYALSVTAPWKATIADMDLRAKHRADIAGGIKEKSDQAVEDLKSLAHNVMHSTLVDLGGKYGSISFDQFQSILNNPEAIRNMSQQDRDILIHGAQDYYHKLYATIDQQASERRGGVNSIKEDAGSADYSGTITSQLAMVQNLVKDLTTGDMSMAARTTRDIKNATDSALRNMMYGNDVNLANLTRVSAALGKIMPQSAGEIVKGAFTRILFPKGIDTILDYRKKEMATHPDGTPVVLADILDKMHKSGIGVTNKQDNAAYKDLAVDHVNMVSKNKNISVEAKNNTYTSVFGKGNEDLIKKFAPDEVTPDGKIKAGQNEIFWKMLSKNVVDDVWKVSQSNPELWPQMTKFAENNFGYLFGTNIAALNRMADNPAVRFTYDADQHVLKAIPTASLYQTSPSNLPGNVLSGYNQRLAFINSGIEALSRVAEKDGRDVNAYILEQLKNQGLQPETIGAKIETAVKAAVSDGATDIASLGYKAPTLQDYTEATPKNAGADQIKGTANAAHISTYWGNPLDHNTFMHDHLQVIDTPAGPISVNKVAANAFEGFIKDLTAEGYKIKHISGYNFRNAKSPTGASLNKLSQHAWGNAIDINGITENKYPGQPITAYNRSHYTNLPSNVSDLAAKWGLTWGGDWHHADTMHFEFTGKLPKMTDPGYAMK